ncbi:hypothetical protein FBY34_7837 [Streptomyces sp. SLBN-115]|nr:hypothetical protein FBY34_7837 [Streptomyces sp. SLBN-115]
MSFHAHIAGLFLRPVFQDGLQSGQDSNAVRCRQL